MNAVARQTLRELRSLRNIETYLRTAKAELASNPCDDTLRAFIGIVEELLRNECAKLADAGASGGQPALAAKP
jgi:hypothetical protein